MEALYMSNTSLRKRARVLAPIIVLSIVLTAITAFATSQLITAKKGGTIDIAPGVELVFRPNSLEEDTVISADMSVKRNRIVYRFGPDGTVLSKPARFVVSWQVIEDADVDNLVLYGENGEEIEPVERKKCLVYEIDHFSLYYHRRR